MSRSRVSCLTGTIPGTTRTWTSWVVAADRDVAVLSGLELAFLKFERNVYARVGNTSCMESRISVSVVGLLGSILVHTVQGLMGTLWSSICASKIVRCFESILSCPLLWRVLLKADPLASRSFENLRMETLFLSVVRAPEAAGKRRRFIPKGTDQKATLSSSVRKGVRLGKTQSLQSVTAGLLYSLIC